MDNMDKLDRKFCGLEQKGWLGKTRVIVSSMADYDNQASVQIEKYLDSHCILPHAKSRRQLPNTSQQHKSMKIN